MMNNQKSILFLGKKDDKHTVEASKFVESQFKSSDIFLGDWGQSFPEELSSWEGDYIISYLSRWIVPQVLLERAKNSAINFHPASPDYPGIGCNNFALYNEEEFFGITCHFMLPKVDSGDIIATKKFPIFESDNVSTLLSKTYDHQLELFYEIMNKILSGEDLNPSGEKWGRDPYTREEFNQLSIITPNMDKHEIQRRIRATKFGKFKPYLKIKDFIFEYKGKNESAID